MGVTIMHRKKNILAWILVLGCLPSFIYADILGDIARDVGEVAGAGASIAEDTAKRWEGRLAIGTTTQRGQEEGIAAEGRVAVPYVEKKFKITFINNSADTIKVSPHYYTNIGKIGGTDIYVPPKQSTSPVEISGCLVELSINTHTKPKDAQYKDAPWRYIYSGKEGCGDRTIIISREGDQYKVTGYK